LASAVAINTQTGATYTLASTDQYQALVITSNASTKTVSIPTDATYAFPNGTAITILNTGAGLLTINAVTAGTTTGTRNGGNGSDVANNILLDINTPTTAAMGTSGAGGASGDTAGTIAGGNGGNGGKGAGGGGGGASTNGADSGAGGNGGDGLCFVVEYYGA